MKLSPWAELAIPAVIAACLAPYSEGFKQIPQQSAQSLIAAVVCIGLIIPQTRRYVLLWVAVGVAAVSAVLLRDLMRTVPVSQAEYWVEVGMRITVGLLAAYSAIRMAFKGETNSTQITYLAALGFYFLGHGYISLVNGRKNYPVLLIGVGVMALVICVLRIRNSNTPAAPKTLSKPRKRPINWS